MSAYVKLMTPMTDEECLVAAILDQGLSVASIERSTTPLKLRGWQRGQTANIVIRKEVTGDSFNDIGFLKTPLGYTAILSDDHPHFGRNWLSQINYSYQQQIKLKHERLAAEAQRLIEEERMRAEEERLRLEEERKRLVEAQRQEVYLRAKKMGYKVKETRESNGIRLVLVKRTY
ncbi:MAG: hypothetical protein AB7F21_06985 [Desulfuromonadales bacterium]